MWHTEGVLVCCEQHVRQAMWDHARDDARHECTGILIGQAFQDVERDLPFVMLTQAIRLHAQSSSEVHVYVGTEQMAQSCANIRQEYPGYLIVGWYHTHPNLGIFLSSVDNVVTRGLFNASWQVAIVIDPIRKEEGVFVQQGKQKLQRMPTIEYTSPIVPLMSYYRHGQAQLEQGQMKDAEHTFAKLQNLFQTAAQSEHRDDLQLWLKQGTYRDTDKLLNQAVEAQKHGLVAGAAPMSQPSYHESANEQLSESTPTDMKYHQDSESRSSEQRRSSSEQTTLLLLLIISLASLGFIFATLIVSLLQNQTLTNQQERIEEIMTTQATLEAEIQLVATNVRIPDNQEPGSSFLENTSIPSVQTEQSTGNADVSPSIKPTITPTSTVVATATPTPGSTPTFDNE
jgi:proteasome lid subunit RPN8/RPN11